MAAAATAMMVVITPGPATANAVAGSGGWADSGAVPPAGAPTDRTLGSWPGRWGPRRISSTAAPTSRASVPAVLPPATSAAATQVSDPSDPSVSPEAVAPATETQAPATATAATPSASLVTGAGAANRSGLPWASGVYDAGSNPATAEAFAAWRGRPVDTVVDWAARATWSDIVSPTWLYDAWRDTPYTKVFGIAPVPEGDPTATMAGCAAGSYTDEWLRFGRNISDAGLADGTIIRLGWEFNGDWYKWRATDPAQFVRCWQQIVGTVETVAPGLRWDWSVNRGPGQSVADPREAYPGDAYVDIVGVDSYDMWPPATDEAGWQQQYAGAYGLKFWADFAAGHGKKLSVPEWGVYPGSAQAGHNGGDNPFYVAKMTQFFRSQGNALAYEAYFNESASYYAGSLFAPAQAPAAALQYRQALTG